MRKMMPARGGPGKLGSSPNTTLNFFLKNKIARQEMDSYERGLCRSGKLTSSHSISEHWRSHFSNISFRLFFLHIGIYIPFWDKFS